VELGRAWLAQGVKMADLLIATVLRLKNGEIPWGNLEKDGKIGENPMVFFWETW
jgi:hypothetical protein